MDATKPEQNTQVRTILIVDDHPVLRRGLSALIENEADLAVFGEVATYQAALEVLRDRQPDLAIVDIALEGRDGLELIKELKTRHPKIPTMVLSMYDESVYAERSLSAGAKGYVTKQEFDENVLLAIRRVLDGELHMSAPLQRRLAAKYVFGKSLALDSPINALSARELQVFRMIGEGQSTRQIAETLCLSIKTIESHVEHIKDKLSLSSAVELAHYATEWVAVGQHDN